MEIDSESDEPQAVNSAGPWTSLIHKGPYFLPPYQRLPPRVRLKYAGQRVELSEEAEEMAVAYAKLLNTDKGVEFTMKPNITSRFFTDWKQKMTPEERNRIVDFAKCDFDLIKEHILNQPEASNVSSETEEAYKFCYLNEERTEIANWKMEPPGIFKGARKSKCSGMWKRRISPEDVTINCSSGWEPSAPEGHQWKEIVENKNVQWLAQWKCPVTGGAKYVRLSSSATPKGVQDREKYDVASKLGKYIDDIREEYTNNWTSSGLEEKQLALVLYFVDEFAFRAGNDRSNDPLASDTYGCCSLRKKHVTLLEGGNIEFDFDGKASVPYQNSKQIEIGAFDALKSLLENKKPSDRIFDRISTRNVNSFLQLYDEQFSIKVFRTYRASSMMEAELSRTRNEMSHEAKLQTFEKGNLEVAKFCNHQKSSRESSEPSPATSLENYIDPRIVIAWCKNNQININMVYKSEELLAKFKWADNTEDSYEFVPVPGPSGTRTYAQQTKPSISSFCNKLRAKRAAT